MEQVYWTALSALCALITVVVNYGPKLRQQFGRPECTIAAFDYVGLSHHLGNLQLLLALDIQNIGPKPAPIKHIRCTITGAGYSREMLSYHTGESGAARLFREIWLKPDEHWGDTVQCFRLWNENDERDANAIQAQIRRDRDSAMQRGVAYEVRAEPGTIERALAFFNDQFTIKPGDFTLRLELVAVNSTILGIEEWDFSISSYQMQQLRDLANGYQFGQYGGDTVATWVRLTPKRR